MTAKELFDKHAARFLREYLGNLRWFCEAVDKGVIPRADDETIRGHLRKLKKFMKVDPKSQDEETLLRYGLIVPGLFLGIEPPISALEPERGGFSEKRIRQAVGHVRRLQEVLRYGRQYLNPLSANDSLALREIGNILKNAAVSSETWVQMHFELPEVEARALAKRAFAALDGGEPEDIGTGILTSLANYRKNGLGTQTAELLSRDLYWPSSLYLNAPDDVTSELIERIADLSRLELNHSLLALAWTRGELARRTFLGWKMDPPRWTKQLHVPPEQYLHFAGWALDAKGGRRELISKKCFRIAQRGDAIGHSVPCRTQTNEKCPICQGQLAWLFDFGNLPPELFREDRANAPTRVLCCLSCACFSPGIFSRYRKDGTAEWHTATESGETKSYPRSEASDRELILKEFPPFAAAEPFGVEDATSLGGSPMWLQNAEYPFCPDCKDVMTFLAQFDNGSMKPCEEGIFYSFFCGKCSVAAVTYQQT